MIWHVGLLYRMGKFLSLFSDTPLTKEILNSNFPTFHGVETERLYSIALIGDWLTIKKNGRIFVTDKGEKIINLMDRPTIQIRIQIMELFEKIKPYWTPLLVQGRKAFISYAPPEVVQCFREAGILDSLEQEVIDWLDQIIAQFHPKKSVSLIKIGRKGEKLTYLYEKDRTGKAPNWIALDYEGVGYDLISVVSKNNLSPLLIEVKTSTKEWNKAKFHLTRNEWEVLSSHQQAVLHLWSIINQPFKHLVIPVANLDSHVPKDKGKGQWEVFVCPFSIFNPCDRQEFVINKCID